MKTEKFRSSGNVFSLCHINTRSLSRKVHQFETYLDLLKHRFTVIGLTGTWLKHSNCDLYGIKGYHLIEKHRKSPKRWSGSLHQRSFEVF